MSYFIKVYSGLIVAIIEVLLIFGFLTMAILTGNSEGLGSRASWMLVPFMLALYLLGINFVILIVVALPFYLLVQKFWQFSFFAAALLGLLVGIAHNLAFIIIWNCSLAGSGLPFTLVFGPIFGMILHICYCAFNSSQGSASSSS